MPKKKLIDRFKESNFNKFLRDKVKPVAGDVLEIVGDLTGVEAIEKVGNLLNKNKDVSEAHNQLWLEFEKYKMNWELEMHKINMQFEIDTYASEVEDRISARTREVEFIKTTGNRDWVMTLVVITGLLLLVGTVAALVFITIPGDNQRLADMSFGAIMSIGASIFSYYVGSSRGARLANETIHKSFGNK